MPRRRPGRRKRWDLLDWRHKTISAAWQGCDNATAEQPAQSGYVNGEVTLLDYPSGPDSFEEFALRYHAVAPFHEGHKNIKRPTANRNLPAIDN